MTAEKAENTKSHSFIHMGDEEKLLYNPMKLHPLQLNTISWLN